MPRNSKTGDVVLSEYHAVYLLAILESHLTGLRGTNDTLAVAVARKPEWPEMMEHDFGGEAHPFTSNKSGKTFYGWFVPLKHRIWLVQQVKGYADTFSVGYLTELDYDAIIYKLEKAIPLDERGEASETD